MWEQCSDGDTIRLFLDDYILVKDFLMIGIISCSIVYRFGINTQTKVKKKTEWGHGGGVVANTGSDWLIFANV